MPYNVINGNEDVNGDNTQPIRCATLNVGGLRGKLGSNDLSLMLNEYDIIALQETKTDDIDNTFLIDYFESLGFLCFITNRSSFSKTRSGGLIFLVKAWLRGKVNFLSGTDNAQWLLFEHGALLVDHSVLLGNIYVPPESSKYANVSIFDDLENFLLDYSNRQNYSVLLLGDFNSHTGTLYDVVDRHNTVGIDNDAMHLQLYAIPARSSKDNHAPDNFGRRLIELCKNQDLFILNGRVGSDRGKGEVTTKTDSLIDYVISSHALSEVVLDLHVEPFDLLFSDVHCCVCIDLPFSTRGDIHDVQVEPGIDNHNTRGVEHDPRVRFNWDESKSDGFLNNIDQRKINELLIGLDNANVNVNDVAQDILSMFVDAGTQTFGITEPKTRRSVNVKSRNGRLQKRQPWFNRDCKTKRSQYLKAKNRFRATRTEDDRKLFNTLNKDYKTAIANNRSAYYDKQANDLRTLRRSNSKKYWKITKPRKRNNTCEQININTLFETFEELNKGPEDDDINDFEPVINVDNEILDRPLTEDEILKAIKSLKTSKAAGIDSITNEFLKKSVDLMLPVYTKLFNHILDTGDVPQLWLDGIIVPLYKNKGDPGDPRNYRGLTILSCLGKLFTSILNNRLCSYCDDNNIINLNQAGFRKGFRTTDHVFVLKGLLDLMLKSKRKLFCAMIDFRRAFDTIWRAGLWLKLLRNGITGKCFVVIKNMYSNIRSCVLHSNHVSGYFHSHIGVRQGENLSPLLFALFVNDMESFLLENGATPLTIDGTVDNVVGYVKLLLLLYADDTILISDTAEGLQLSLDILERYCSLWKLEVNDSKTKIIIFAKRKPRTQFEFRYQGLLLEIVDEFKYLGVVFQSNGNFSKHKLYAKNQAQKAMFDVLRNSRNSSLPIDVQLHLFDTVVDPILTYGCEVWGFENLKILESLHLKFLKYVLRVKKSTPTCMVYGEVGRFPLSIKIFARMVKFWAYIVQGRHDKITYTIYQMLLNKNTSMSSWLTHINFILQSTGFGEVWFNQCANVNPEFLGKAVLRTLQDQFLQSWRHDLENSRKCLTYSRIKLEIGFEAYLELPERLRFILCKFRLSNHKLIVETGRYTNIPFEERYCNFCNSGQVGDEYHVLLECPALTQLRAEHFKPYYFRRPSFQKYIELWNKKSNLPKIARFLLNCNKTYKLF